MKVACVIAVLSLAGFMRAQEASPFLTHQQVVAQGINFAVRMADTALTCRNLQRGWVEAMEPTQSCKGVALWTMSGVPASIGISYLLHRHGHDRLSLMVPLVFAGGSGVGITYSIWPRHWHKCATNQPCN